MAENEVSAVKIGHLYYPRAVQGANHDTAQRVGPTRFSLARTSPEDAKKLFADSKGIGHWYPAEIARNFRPAPDVGSTWRPSGAAFSIPRIVLSVDETAIRTDRGTFLPGTFLDTFEPDTYPIAFPAALPWPTPSWFRESLREPDRYDALAFAVGWGKLPTGPISVPSPRDALLAAIDAFREREADAEFTAAMAVARAVCDLIAAERNGRGPTRADRALRAPLEKAIDAYDNAPDGGLIDASPVLAAVDALIAACRAAR